MGSIGSKLLEAYSKEEIGDIVASYGSSYAGYKKDVLESNVDGQLLAALSEDEFVKKVLDNLNVTNRIHRRKFLHVFRSAVFLSASALSSTSVAVSVPERSRRRGSFGAATALASTGSPICVPQRRRSSLGAPSALEASEMSLSSKAFPVKAPRATSPSSPSPPKNSRSRKYPRRLSLKSPGRSRSPMMSIASTSPTSSGASSLSSSCHGIMAAANQVPLTRATSHGSASFSDPDMLPTIKCPTRRRSFTIPQFNASLEKLLKEADMESGDGSSTFNDGDSADSTNSFVFDTSDNYAENSGPSQESPPCTHARHQEQEVLIEDMIALFDRQFEENESLRKSMTRLEVESLNSRKSIHAPKSGKAAIVLTDIAGSTQLWESDEIAMRKALDLHDKMVRKSCAEYYGYEIDTEGDAFFLAFHEASDAISFSLDLQEALNEAPWGDDILSLPPAKEDQHRRGLRVRISISLGDIESRKNPVTGRTFYTGPAWDAAKRVEELAKGGQILLSDECWQAAQTNLDADLSDLPKVANLGFYPVSWSGYTFQRILEIAPASMSLIHQETSKDECCNHQCSSSTHSTALYASFASDTSLDREEAAMGKYCDKSMKEQPPQPVSSTFNGLVSLSDESIFV